MRRLLGEYDILRAAHEAFLLAAVYAADTQELFLRVALFGSARAKKTSVQYQKATELAFELATRNFDIVSGGGPGIMEAANKGASEALGKTKSISLPIGFPGEEPNGYADIQFGSDDFTLRLIWFKILCCAYVCYWGGIGTLYELADILQHVQLLRNMVLKKDKEERKTLPKIFPLNPACVLGFVPPIILVGKSLWSPIIKLLNIMAKQGTINEENKDLVILVQTNEEVLAILEKSRQQWRHILRENGREPRN